MSPRTQAPGRAARQASLRRMHEHGIVPNTDLGQNFLVDDNVLGVIDRAAELTGADVVLEVGGGLGVLSEFLAARVAHAHVVEVDRRLVPALEDALAAHANNTTLHVDDAVRMDLAALRPEPTKVVANLPYGVAATVLLKTVDELPGVGRWVAMVQREVAERLAAPPGSRTYGATSAIAQLSCSVRLHRRVARTIFHPVPNVDSALVVLERERPPAAPEVRALVQAAFAHRRKALSRSLSHVPGVPADAREAIRSALRSIGQPADARAERLAAADFVALAERLGPEVLGPVAAAGRRSAAPLQARSAERDGG